MTIYKDRELWLALQSLGKTNGRPAKECAWLDVPAEYLCTPPPQKKKKKKIVMVGQDMKFFTSSRLQGRGITFGGVKVSCLVKIAYI